MADPKVHTCIDRALPPDLLIPAALAAIKENPANRIHVPHALPTGVDKPFSPAAAGAAMPMGMAIVTQKRWAQNRLLHVRFLDGDPQVQFRLKKFANEWSQYCNIKFMFDNAENAEIRISFDPNNGSWSYIGTDCLMVPPGEATMNLGWLTMDTEDDEYSRVVIHEFGHALGCLHEHQNPAGGIQWNKDAVYRYYEGPPNNWSKDEVDNNLFTTYEADLTQFTAVDGKSIMMYPIPEGFTTDGFTVGWNKVLSPTDENFIGQIYPK